MTTHAIVYKQFGTLLQGRLAPSTADVAALAGPVLKHRMALSFAARADGLQLDTLIARLAAEAA